MASFWNELRRRNVVRVGIAYALVAYVALQAIDFALEIISAPHWILQVSAMLAAIGFPSVLIFAWVYEMTPEGLKPESQVDRSHSIAPVTARKLDRAIIGILVIAVAALGARQFLFPGNENVTTEVADSGPASIAVLPFEDYSEAKDQEYFSKGIAEEILNLLAKTDSLKVAARTSSFAFDSHDTDIREIGQKLDVSTVLEGSIRKAGTKIRITAQLINVEDGYHLWSETYDRDYNDIFRIQDEIAASIIESLKVHLLGDEHQQMVSERSANVDAYSAYLIGKERMALRTQEDITAARTQFEKALEIDPNFAPAHVQLAHAWLLLEQNRFGGKDIEHDDVDKAIIPHLEEAIALAPNLPEAIAVSGYHHLRRYRYAEAAQAFDRAIELNPNYALAYNWRADTAYEQGHYLEMLADKEKAYALDPMSLEISADLAYEYRSFWRPEDAERVIQRMFDLHPDHPLAYKAAMSNLDAIGREADAALLAEKAMAAHPDNEEFKEWKAWNLAEIGLTELVLPLGVDHASYMALMTEGRHAEAKALVDKHLAEEKPDLEWLYIGRHFYYLVEGPAAQPKLAELMARTIARIDAENHPWRDHCSPFFADDLQRAGYAQEAGQVMDVCRKRYEQRLEAEYLCPCEWFGLVMFTVLDNKHELAVQRTEKWLNDGDSSAFLNANTVFRRLANRPEYESLMERNAALVKKKQEHFLERTVAGPIEVAQVDTFKP